MLVEAIAGAQLATHDARIDIVGAGAAHAPHAAGVVEQDEIAHLADIGGSPGLQVGS
ncbi:hypothetical protein D9M72_632480 [compost metagenome]